MKHIIAFFVCLFLQQLHGFRPQPNPNSFNHLDNTNLERLEKMFYLKNSRYHPMRNRIVQKFNFNSTSTPRVRRGEHNITNVLERINDEFIRQYKEQIEADEREELELGDHDDNFDVAENNRKNGNKNGYFDENGVFRYHQNHRYNGTRIIISTPGTMSFNTRSNDNDNEGQFKIIRNSDISFKDVGGYDKVKQELMQTADILVNFTKYKRFNVRTPKGIVFEGPPGNGKTLLAKSFCGELNISFIPVSGSEFAEKYVGVGASRVRELFQLAGQNVPCIVFIDEIDALGRKRSNDDSSNSEKDQTLNELLVCLDGFKESEGVFVIGATNRFDLLDSALVRPGRMDKNIYIGNPDSETRKEIITIHSQGKPMSEDISMDDLVETTGGFSGAQIENLLNEAMLFALREDREMITKNDLEYILNRIYAGWQTKESKYSDDIIERITIHEMGHAIVGFLSHEHSKLAKIVLNLWSPKTPGYTIFENSDEDSNIYTKNGLFTHLMVLLAGRIAEEVFFGYSVTTGARQDLEQAYNLAKNMILNYGMGKQNIYPDMSDHSKYLIDQEVSKLLMLANDSARIMILKVKNLMVDCAEILKRDKLLKPEQIVELIDEKYPEIWNVYDVRDDYIQ